MLLLKRARSLLVPYLLINFMWFFGYNLWTFLAVRIFGSAEVVDFSLMGFIRAIGIDFNHTPIVSALWYIRCLMIFFCILPILMMIMKRSKKVSYIVSILVFFSATAYEITDCEFFPLFGFNMRGLAFFVMGAHLCLWGGIKMHRAAGPILLVGAIVANRLGFRIPAIALLLGAAWLLFPAFEVSSIRSYSFSIYLFHQIVIFHLLILFRYFKISPYTLISEAFLMALCVLVPIVLARLLTRYTPRLSMLMLGGRVK